MTNTRLSTIAAVSGFYDFLVGAGLLLARDQIATVFGVPSPVPPIHSDLNGLFLIAVAVGYVLPYRDPDHHRGYLWIMGPFLKGVGALFFVVDHVVRRSPASFLLVAVSDGTLALLTLWALTAPAPATRVAEATHV